MNCLTCTLVFNKTTRRPVECPKCSTQACRACVHKHLVASELIECQTCLASWSASDLAKMISKGYPASLKKDRQIVKTVVPEPSTHSENRRVQLGLCCINTVLREQKTPVYSSRSCVLKTFQEKGLEVAQELALQTLRDTIQMMEWNERHGIKVFRLSSDIFPHFSNPQVERYSLDFAQDLLSEIGALARRLNMRLTFHPGQYNVVGTPSESAFEKTVLDLSCHAEILDRMSTPPDSIMVVHGGGLYGDKEKTIQRWIDNFSKLPEPVRRRLVLENCEKCFNVEDCLRVSEAVNIPVVFDTHHFECYAISHPQESFQEPKEYIPRILDSWRRRGIKPKFHVSEQGEGRLGHHSDFIQAIPDYLMEIPDKYDVDIDVMIEAKMKEQAIFRLYEKYPHLSCKCC